MEDRISILQVIPPRNGPQISRMYLAIGLLLTPFINGFAPLRCFNPPIISSSEKATFQWRLHDVNDNSQHLASLMANSEKDEASINSTISDLESTFHAKPIPKDASRFNDLIGLLRF